MEGPRRIAVLGGVYSNWLALQATLVDARKRGAEEIYCLGDLGAFGPHPDRVWIVGIGYGRNVQHCRTVPHGAGEHMLTYKVLPGLVVGAARVAAASRLQAKEPAA